MEDINEKLNELYHDPKKGYSGINKLFNRAKAEGLDLKKKDVVNFLNGVDTYQRFTKKEPYNSFVANHPLEEFQFDLIVMKDLSKVDYEYCFTCIDVCTRVGDAEPIKNKTAGEALGAFKKIIRRMGKPKQIYADQGSEWMGVFGKYLDDENINSIFVTTHAPFVERFNQTLKNLLHRYMTEYGYHRWRDILPDIINNYNTSYHSIIKMSPQEATKNFVDAVTNTLRQASMNKRPRLKEGDVVRLARTKNIFTKGYLPTYSAKQYKIENVEDGMYYLEGHELGVPRSHIKRFSEITTEEPVKEDEEEKTRPKFTAKRRLRSEGVDAANVVKGKTRAEAAPRRSKRLTNA